MFDTGQGGRAGTAAVAGDENVVRVRLGHTGRDRSHTDLCDQFDADPRLRIGIFQVIDQLRQIFDRVNIMVRRWADQPYTRCRIADSGDGFIDFAARQFPAFTGFGPLGYLDLNLIGVGKVPDGYAKPARRHLLDGRTFEIPVG